MSTVTMLPTATPITTVFEHLAFGAPVVLVTLERRGLLVIDDYIDTPAARLMRRAAYRRMGRRTRQVRVA